MSLHPNVILAPRTVTVEISLASFYSVLNSLTLISFAHHNGGVDEWVGRTARALTPEQTQRHRLVIGGLFDVLVAFAEDLGRPDFPAYLEALAAADPVALRDSGLRGLTQRVARTPLARSAGLQVPPPDLLLSDLDVYLAFWRELARLEQPEKGFDEALHAEAYALRNDPPALRDTLYADLREMWNEFMAAEWARALPMLEESVEAFRRLDLTGLTAMEAIRAVTGRDMRGLLDDELVNVEHLIFVPSAHLGPYLSNIALGSSMVILFRARVPEGVRPRSPEITRSEILVRLSALADDTRLRILELLTHHDELCAQEIISRLDLSQSAASRHLRQLSATGYVIERRHEGNKCYTLNPDRVEATLRALSGFLLGR